MNPFAFVWRHPILTLLLVLVLAAVGVAVAEKSGVDVVPGVDAARIDAALGRARAFAMEHVGGGAKAEGHEEEGEHHARHTIVATSPKVMDVTITEPYVCQVHSRRHIEVRALEGGYLAEIKVNEGQAVKQGDLMFKILPTLYQARLDAEEAEARLAQLEYNNTKRLSEQNVVSENEVKLLDAKLAKALAKVKLAKAELDFTNVVAPFDGIVDKLHKQLGSLIAEGDDLTTLSDNAVMWVYFNVPEARYLEYMSDKRQHREDDRVELLLANGNKFAEHGKIAVIEAQFNNETGNIAFRADFPNPDGLLRHGQTGTVLISRVHAGALVIPQRATFEVLDKRYVFAVDEHGVAHQRLITIEHEKDDIFLVKSGLSESDRIVIEGVREVRDGEEVEYEYRAPEEVLKNLKFHAE